MPRYLDMLSPRHVHTATHRRLLLPCARLEHRRRPQPAPFYASKVSAQWLSGDSLTSSGPASLSVAARPGPQRCRPEQLAIDPPCWHRAASPFRAASCLGEQGERLIAVRDSSGWARQWFKAGCKGAGVGATRRCSVNIEARGSPVYEHQPSGNGHLCTSSHHTSA